MAAGIQLRHQRLGGADRRIVFVLADRGDHLAFPRRHLGLGQRRRHHDFAEQRQHRFEIFGEARADEREDVPGDRDRQRDAAAVELFGDRRRRASGGAPVDDAATAATSPLAPGGSYADPAWSARLMVTAASSAHLGEQHDPVIKRETRRRQPLRDV